MTVPVLPVELYSEILKHIQTSPDEGWKLLVTIQRCNTRLRAAVLAPEIWKPHYGARYVHCVEEREKQRRDASGNNWRELFIQRRLLDQKALQLLDDIRKDARDRYSKAAVIADLSFDVWDALRLESMIPIPLCFRESYGERDEADVPSDALPRRFWANAVLGVIARRQAFDIWRCAFSEEDVSFEQALASLSSVYDVSLKEIIVLLDDIYQQCKDELAALDVCLDPQIPSYDISEICVQIRTILRDMGFRLATTHRFYRLLTQFPHAFLQPGQRDTIPMALVYVFVAVCRRLGIHASPVNSPGAVLARVSARDGDIIVDVSTGKCPARASNIDGLRMTVDETVMTSPANSATMITRAFQNIFNFIRFEQMHENGSYSSENRANVLYLLTLCGAAFLPNNFRGALPVPPPTKPLDYRLVMLDVLERHISPDLRPEFRSAVESQVEDDYSRATQVCSRKDADNVKYFIGLVFRHVQYSYVGCITHWDTTCHASEEWIIEMKVDRLPSGRNQPFYMAMTDAGNNTRYVAQENIEPIMPSENELRQLYLSCSIFSRYVAGPAHDGLPQPIRLNMTDELKAIYPEDDEYGHNWVKLQGSIMAKNSKGM